MCERSKSDGGRKGSVDAQHCSIAQGKAAATAAKPAESRSSMK